MATMMSPNEIRRMPITSTPYDHQQKAFEFVLVEFVLGIFGVLDDAKKSDGFEQKKEGDANDSNQ